MTKERYRSFAVVPLSDSDNRGAGANPGGKFEGMTPFEDDLKKALARVEPPDGFTERLAARIAALPPQKRPPVYWRWAAAAAAAVVLVSGVSYEHERQARGEAAKEKLLLAMRITGSKLAQAQHRIEEVESH